MRKIGGLVLCVTVLAITAARGETPQERQACTDDAFRVCGDAIPDRNRVFSCLISKKDSISPLCRTALAPYLPPDPRPTAKSVSKVKKAKAKNSAKRGPVDLNPR